MMLRRLLALTARLTLALALAGCAASTTPGWTYAPPPSATPVPSAAPSESASTPGPSAAPSDGASAAPSGGGSAGGATIALAALNIAFDQSDLKAPADTAFTISFDNQDQGIPHNVEILDAGGASVFKGEIVNGPTKVDYQVPALKAGAYKFVCTVHPNMMGTLTVG